MRKIAFFLRSPKFSGNWSLDEDAVPLSGTDSSMLFVIRTLRESDKFEPVLIGKSPPVEESAEFHAATMLPAAYEAARKAGAERLIFNGAWIEEIREMGALPADGPELVLWAQNSPSFEWQCEAQQLPQFLRVVAVSDAQCYAFSPHRIYSRTLSIPNPAPPAAHWSRPADNAPIRRRQICFVGALKPSKGFHHLARVWPAFHERHPEIDLIVCGSSSLYDPTSVCGSGGFTDEPYEREILGLLGGTVEAAKTKGVFFRGSLTKPELRDEVRKSLFVVVNPNLRGSTETFCCSAVEAQSLGVPVVAAHADALRETVGHGVGGLLFKRSADFLPLLLRMAGDENLRSELGARGYAHVTSAYQRGNIAARWLDFLEGKALPRFAGSISGWATWSDHVKSLQRFIPPGAGLALRRLKSNLRRNATSFASAC